MAAKLKKRAMAEYNSSVVQVEDSNSSSSSAVSDRAKRLKLSLRESISDVESVAMESPSPLPSLNTETLGVREVMANILGVNPREVTGEGVASAVKTIQESLAREKDPCVRARLVLVWADIMSQDAVEELSLRVEEMLAIKETSSRVLSAWMTAIRKVVMAHNLGKNLKMKIFSVASSVLHSSPHPVLHAKVLHLISSLVSPDHPGVSGPALELCGSYSMSQDARVRTAAFHGLLTIHKRGVKLDVSMYNVFYTALTDDYEGVRCEALTILAAMAETDPEYQVEVDTGASRSVVGGQTIRLVDDVFSRTCQAINDVRETVRVLAARLIGEMRGVSQGYLEQTLDKKLMSNMRTKRNAHERMAGLVSSGEWSSGSRWADDAPKERVEADEINLVSFGSCGAFVHGLEDECLSVRTAAVRSLRRLAVGNQALAILALDFLVDMFNDEIEQVRLEAIESLTAIARHIKLHVHQLEIVLGGLDDFSTRLREKLHVMIQACTIATKDGLNMVIDKLLLVNLKRYPQDRRSIYVTFKHLGANHPDLTLPLITSLLKIHPYFDKQEEDIEDPAYLCKLILVLNAAQHCPSLPQLLDNHTQRHQSYLRDTFPHLIPSSSSSSSSTTPVVKSKTAEFLKSVLSRVSSSAKLPASRLMSILNTSINELVRLAAIEPSLSDPSSFAKMYLEGQMTFLRIVTDTSWTQASLQHGPVTKNNIATLQAIVLKLHSMFSSIGDENQLQLKMMKLKVIAVNLVYTVCGSNKSALGLTDAFIKEFEALTKEMSQENIDKEPFLAGVKEMLSAAEVKPGYLAKKLRPLLISNPIRGLLTVPLDIKMAKAIINEPTGGSETPMKYMAGLVLGIPMDCQVYNITDTDLLRICIFTGDQQHHLSLPRRGDLVTSDDGGLRLLTTAQMSHHVWSEPSDVEVSLVLDLAGDRKKDKTNIVHLCKPVKVSVLPKPVRRGI